MKLGVPAALAQLRDPVLRWAVVFDTDRWINDRGQPVQPPEGHRWDYEPFAMLERAREALADPAPYQTDLELWEKREDGWHPVEGCWQCRNPLADGDGCDACEA